MAIVIFPAGDLYEATVTPPHGRGVRWASPQPMTANSLVAALRELGCHQTDIGDAFHDADPGSLGK
jgi:hypothetical protein